MVMMKRIEREFKVDLMILKGKSMSMRIRLLLESKTLIGQDTVLGRKSSVSSCELVN